MTRPLARRFHARVLCLAVASLAATTAHAADPTDPPDLVPVTVIGPEKVEVGSETVCHLAVANFGGDLQGTYTAEIVLSKDSSIDPSDPVAASLTTAIIGTHAVTATIPSGLQQGPWHWALRLVDVAGELATGNNALLGIQVNLIDVDLDLLDASPISIFARPTDVTQPQASVSVINTGTSGTIVVYHAEPVAPAPWLVIDPPEGFAVAGLAPNPTLLRVQHQDLALGKHETVVRFTNVMDETDYAEVPVSVEIGDPLFVPGDRLVGQVASPGEVDEVVFDGLNGMKLRLKVATKAGNLAPWIRVLDPSGIVVKEFHLKKGAFKKTVKLKASGEHRLLISGTGNVTGGYEVGTGRKLPKKAQSLSTNVDAEHDTIIRRALAGATLDLSAKSKGPAVSGLTLALMQPDGSMLDLSSLTATQDEYMYLQAVPLTATGDYGIRVLGQAAGDKVKVHLNLIQPAKGTSILYLP